MLNKCWLNCWIYHIFTIHLLHLRQTNVILYLKWINHSLCGRCINYTLFCLNVKTNFGVSLSPFGGYDKNLERYIDLSKLPVMQGDWLTHPDLPVISGFKMESPVLSKLGQPTLMGTCGSRDMNPVLLSPNTEFFLILLGLVCLFLLPTLVISCGHGHKIYPAHWLALRGEFSEWWWLSVLCPAVLEPKAKKERCTLPNRSFYVFHVRYFSPNIKVIEKYWKT